MSDREGSRSPGDHKQLMERDRSPHARRSDSPSRTHHKARSYSRSPSRGRKMSYRGDGDRDRERRRDRDDDREERRDSRRRHTGTRDHPKPSRCIGVFGLSVYTTEDELYHIMCKYGPVERVQVVIDAKTGRSRGFSFVYFESTEDAKVAKEQCTGMKINGKKIRVDYSITARAHTPTPGIYMGKPTYKYNDRYERRRGERDDYHSSRGSRYSSSHRRSNSPYYRRRRYERSRSRSYSPRRY